MRTIPVQQLARSFGTNIRQRDKHPVTLLSLLYVCLDEPGKKKYSILKRCLENVSNVIQIKVTKNNFCNINLICYLPWDLVLCIALVPKVFLFIGLTTLGTFIKI